MLKVRSVEEMREFGKTLAAKLSAGDIVVLSGALGAGKTALTQGIGEFLGIAGVTSPTFVISRVHKGATPLIHVDAYRLLAGANSKFEFDDLDLDTGRESAITVIEWGGQVGERFGEDFLELVIKFGSEENEREISSIPHGKRWSDFQL
mgnify:CR=1 FL=1